jgi:DTW domain-containing protein
MTLTPPSKRASCARCLRAQPACICRWVVPVESPVELLILQHPLEVANAKNSARLLHLCVQGSVLEAGEAFDPERLYALLHAGGRAPLLLYPGTGAAPDAFPMHAPARLRLVLLDATWRKSRKMLHLNPLLDSLPRLALRELASGYGTLRKAHAPDQLSTLEAAAHALARLDGNGAGPRALLAAFDGFVRQQAAWVPGRPSDALAPR